MLNQHLFDGLFGEIRIDGLAAQFVKACEGITKTRVCFVLRFNQFRQRRAELRQLLLKIRDGLLPLFVSGRLIFKKELERFDELLRVVQIRV